MLTSMLWWVWWQRAVTFQAEKGQMVRAWQRSEGQLQQAMRTIDQMAAAVEPVADGQEPPPALLQARQFYERICTEDGPPARMASAHYRLAKIHERLGDRSAARASYQEAIARWETLARAWPDRTDFETQLADSRARLRALSAHK
jgi:tetratricopeptide (TPR) repeat protein